MGIVTDKLCVGKIAWENGIKWSTGRAELDEHKISDIGILYAADCIAELEGIIDAISEMEGDEGMTDAEFVKQTLLIIAHGDPRLPHSDEGG